MAQGNPYDWGHPNYNNPSYTPNYGSSNLEGSQQPSSLQNHGNMPSMSQPHPYAHIASPPYHPSAANGHTNSEQYRQANNQDLINYTVRGPPPGPTGNQNAAQWIPRTPGDTQRPTLNAIYRVRSPDFFAPGVVFRALWTEPAGQVSGITSNRICPTLYEGEYAYNQIRRFAVFEQKSNCALCVPITTYGGKGTTKAGIDRNAHAIIHTSAEAYFLPEEPPLIKRPIKLTAAEESLRIDSRVNFGKVYTIEYNQKVVRQGKSWMKGPLVDSEFEGR